MYSQYFGVIWIVGVLAFTRPTEAWFEECDKTIYMDRIATFNVVQPNFPERYTPGSSCRYKLMAPMDYQAQVTCTINLDKGPNGCDTENFYIHTDGLPQLENSERFCGATTVVRRSLFRNMTLSYTSSNSTGAGSFTCRVQPIIQRCQCGWSTSPKIVGGQEAQINEFPFIAALIARYTQKLICSATIISHKYAVTTASCVSNYFPSQLILLVGEHNMTTGAESPYTMNHFIETIRPHEGFDETTHVNDIALLRTILDINWSRGVGPACVLSLRQLPLFPIRQVEIAGWGASSFGGPQSPVLMKGTTSVVLNIDCRTSIPSLNFGTQMCTNAAPQGPCQFDTGGPLMLRTRTYLYLVGLISYGERCGTSTPTVSTRISSYLDWLIVGMNEFLCGT